MRENLNFERGFDPKRLMGIGGPEKRVFRTVSEAAQWALLYPQICTNKKIENWDQWAPSNYELNSVSFKLQLVKFFGGECKWEEEEKNYDDQHMGLRSGKNIVNRLFEFLNEIYERKKLKESYHFERNREPKGAMQIGMETKLQEFIEQESKTIIPVHKSFWENAKNDAILHQLVIKHKPELLEYFIKSRNMNNIREYELRQAAFMSDKAICQILINYGIDIKETLKQTEIRLGPGHSLKVKTNHKKVRKFLKKHFKSLLTESVHFERNKDPKKAMGIGRESIIKQLFNAHWDFDPKDRSTYYVDELIDYSNDYILVVEKSEKEMGKLYVAITFYGSSAPCYIKHNAVVYCQTLIDKNKDG